MTDHDLRRIADALTEMLRPHLQQSQTVRDAARAVGRWLIDQANLHQSDLSQADAPNARPANSVAPLAELDHEHPPTPAPAPPAPQRPKTGIVQLNLGGATRHLEVPGTTQELGKARQTVEAKARALEHPDSPAAPGERDLALIERRSRLKSESCRLFIERRAAEPGSDVDRLLRERMDRLIATAKSLPQCFLWVFWRERTPPDDATLESIARNYEAQAEAAALVRRVDELEAPEGSDLESDALALLARANSALRVALRSSWLTNDDQDQADAHAWLRRETALRNVYLRRHMTADDPADPALAAECLDRVRDLRQTVEQHATHAKDIRAALNRIRYHANLIARNQPDDDDANDRRRIIDSLERLQALAVPPSDPRIGAAISAEAAERWPESDDDGPLVRAALAALRARAAIRSDAHDPGNADARWSDRVLRVREHLRDRRIVVIGGEQNRPAIERLSDAFDLAEVEWVELAEHGTGAPMRAPIARPETALVVVIIKLTGHLHAEEARRYAAESGKPCVYLTGGYNPEQVAHAVLEQVSAQLAASA